MATNTYGRYTKAYQKAAVSTVDQGKLIVMLYEGAIKYLSVAINKLENGDFYSAHTNIIRGKSIVAELLASLNFEQGGDIATNLQRLYAYMFNELIDANLKRDTARLAHIVDLLKELRAAWKEVLTKNATPGVAAGLSTEGGRTKNINLKG